jgi:hypothetical protein
VLKSGSVPPAPWQLVQFFFKMGSTRANPTFVVWASPSASLSAPESESSSGRTTLDNVPARPLSSSASDELPVASESPPFTLLPVDVLERFDVEVLVAVLEPVPEYGPGAVDITSC